jgi:hypothetical protein
MLNCSGSHPTRLSHQSINVIECPEFRRLIRILRQDIRETDIPHRTKFRELILDAWREYFNVLKQDLAVR